MKHKFFSEPQEVSFFIDANVRAYQIANLSDPPAVIYREFSTIEEAEDWIAERKRAIAVNKLRTEDYLLRSTLHGEDLHPGPDFGELTKQCVECSAPTATKLCDQCFDNLMRS